MIAANLPWYSLDAKKKIANWAIGGSGSAEPPPHLLPIRDRVIEALELHGNDCLKSTIFFLEKEFGSLSEEERKRLRTNLRLEEVPSSFTEVPSGN